LKGKAFVLTPKKTKRNGSFIRKKWRADKEEVDPLSRVVLENKTKGAEALLLKEKNLFDHSKTCSGGRSDGTPHNLGAPFGGSARYLRNPWGRGGLKRESPTKPNKKKKTKNGGAYCESRSHMKELLGRTTLIGGKSLRRQEVENGKDMGAERQNGAHDVKSKKRKEREQGELGGTKKSEPHGK